MSVKRLCVLYCCLKQRKKCLTITLNIRDGLYEFRVTYGNNEFRLFFIFDGEQIVVLFNCFRKKSQKTPKKEINKALKLKGEYYEQKG